MRMRTFLLLLLSLAVLLGGLFFSQRPSAYGRTDARSHSAR